MALIVEYHVVAEMYPVGTEAISAGMLVQLNAAGNVIPITGADSTIALGVAGDSALAAEGQTTAYSDQVTIGADGANSRWTENRVSDFYDETTASQKITVYNGGGKFWISEDLVDGSASIPSTIDSTSWLKTGATAGHYAISGAATIGETICVAVGASQAYPSGVPGTDVTGSITLGNYVPVILKI